jgi:hypothetical protein
MLVVQVTDEQGRALTEGSVMFCPSAGDCLELPLSRSGTIQLDPAVIERQAVYTVMVLGPDRQVRYMTSEWRRDARASGGPPRLVGQAGQKLAVNLGQSRTAVSPEPWRPARVALGAHAVFMLGGHFGADDEALGGITSVSPGPMATLGFRFGLPDDPPRGPFSVGYQELTLSYAQNRYATRQLGPDGGTSDLTFHRVGLAYGRGRIWENWLLGAAVLGTYGGLYDGSEVLEYGNRTYRMFGVGLQGRAGRRLAGSAGRIWSLEAMLGLVYYPVDTNTDDHWYGLSPTATVGLVWR